MASVIVDFGLYIFYVFLLSLFTGLPLAFLIRRGHEDDIKLVELVFLALIFGLFMPACLSFFLEVTIGLKFSEATAQFAYAMTFFLPIFAMMFKINNGSVVFTPSCIVSDISIFAKEVLADIDDLGTLKVQMLPIYLSYALLLAGVVISFFITSSKYSAASFELDPYYYLFPTRYLLTEGTIPAYDDTAFYPDNLKMVTNHRVGPLMNYMVADLYQLVYLKLKPTADQIYDLAIAASIYPPMMMVFLIFAYFLFFKQFKIEIAGPAAAVAGFIPRIIESLSAVEFQLEPIAVFGIVMVVASYFRLIKKVSLQNMFILFAALAITLWGSKSMIFVHVPIVISQLLLVMIASFGLGKQDFVEKLKELMYPFLIYSVLYVIANTIIILYIPTYEQVFKGESWTIFSLIKRVLFDSETIFIISVVGFALMLYVFYLLHLRGILKTPRTAILGFYTVSLMLGLLALPYLKSIGNSFLGQVTFIRPLERTIAEQNLSSNLLEPELGFIGIMLGNSMIVDSLLGIFTNIINVIFVVLIGILNLMLNFDVPLRMPLLTPSMVFVFYSIALYVCISKALKIGFSDPTKFDIKLYAFLFVILLTMIPLTIIKVKFHIYFSLFIVFTVGFSIYFIFELANWLNQTFLKNENLVSKISLLLVALLLVPALQYGNLSQSSPGIHSSFMLALKPKFSDNPELFAEKMRNFCAATRDPLICLYAQPEKLSIADQHSPIACVISQLDDPLAFYTNKVQLSPHEYTAIISRCRFIQQGWLETYEWMRQNVPEDERIISWWDYGHWTNYYGERKTVLRNDHLSHDMILETAHAYVMGDASELKRVMRAYNSSYAMFDREIMFGGAEFGGKFNALNYLACSRNNLTSFKQDVGYSQCESENRWDILYVPVNSKSCDISFVNNLKGVYGAIDNGEQQIQVCMAPNGQLFYANKKNEFGELEPLPSLLLYGGETVDDPKGLKLKVYSIAYLNPDDIKSGKISTKKRVYFSSLYNAFIREQLEGFELVFKSSDNTVKVFKIKED